MNFKGDDRLNDDAASSAAHCAAARLYIVPCLHKGGGGGRVLKEGCAGGVGVRGQFPNHRAAGPGALGGANRPLETPCAQDQVQAIDISRLGENYASLAQASELRARWVSAL
jgi:hypothetical protein